mmetsp:Transcript_63697/g.141834  ORF Transcript_63697/g.141834 Transcript_63697/m.141834 type:complete len:141 (-) Transcript_63697:318-740(-)
MRTMEFAQGGMFVGCVLWLRGGAVAAKAVVSEEIAGLPLQQNLRASPQKKHCLLASFALCPTIQKKRTMETRATKAMQQPLPSGPGPQWLGCSLIQRSSSAKIVAKAKPLPEMHLDDSQQPASMRVAAPDRVNAVSYCSA